MNKRLKVIGKTDILDDLDIHSRLFVQRNVFFYRDIITSANLTVSNITSTGFINGHYQDNSIPRNAISEYGKFFQDVTFPERMFVTKDASFVGHASFGDVSFNKRVAFPDKSIDGRAIIGGVVTDVDFVNDVSMNKRLFIEGDVSLNSNLFLGLDASLNKNLAVAGDTDLTGKLSVLGSASLVDVSVNGALDVSGDSVLQNKLTVKGETTTEDLNVNKVLYLDGDASFNSKLFWKWCKFQ